MSTNENLFYYKIEVYNGSHPGTGIKTRLIWKDLPWEVRIKWTWYYEYRAALLKVENPRSKVVENWGSYKKEGKSRIEFLKTKVSSAKGQVTKILNLLEKAESSWNELFPIYEDPIYQKALIKLNDKVEKLIEAKLELNRYENEVENLQERKA